MRDRATSSRVLSRRFLGRWMLEAADYPCWLVTSARQACSAAISVASLADEPAARRDDEPQSSELADVLAGDLAGADVADVVVERPAVVGDLNPAVLPLDSSDQLALDALSGLQRPRLEVDRPGGRACPVAGARLAPLVSGERVESPALAVEEDG